MKSSLTALFLSASILACWPAPLSAQWVKTGGPEGCYINAIAVDGTKVYAGVARHGLYSSADNGGHWAAVKTGLPRASEITCVEVGDGKVFVGTRDGLVCVSADGGTSWRRIDANAPDPRAERTIDLALIGADLFAVGGFGGYVYPDYASGRGAVGVDLPLEGQILSLAVMGEDLFVGRVWGGVNLIQKRAGTWTVKVLPFPNRDEIDGLAVAGSTLFAGTDNEVLMSTDKGASWTPIASSSRTDQNLTCLAASGQDILAGLSYEDDPPGPMVVRLSRTGGQKWVRTDMGLREAVVECLAVAGAAVFAGTSNGVYVSRNGGTDWDRISSGLPVASSIPSLVAVGTDVFAGSIQGDKYDWRTAYGGLHRSTDEGRTWAPVDKGLPPGSRVSSLAAVGADLFAGLFDHDGEGKGVYRSPDSGRTWTAASGLPQGPYQLAVIGPKIYASAGYKVFVSTDKGAGWASSGRGLPPAWTSCLAAAGEDLFAGKIDYGATRATILGGSYLFAGGPPPAGKLYVLAGGRGKWKDTKIRLSSPIHCLVRIGQDLFMGTASGLYWCEDLAGSPKPAKLKLSTARSVTALAAVGTDLFVGTDEGVVLIRKDGTGWAAVRADMPGTIEVTGLVVSGPYLYAGTTDAGVWRYLIPRD